MLLNRLLRVVLPVAAIIPAQVHVAFTETPDQLAVSFVSDQDYEESASAPRLIFGKWTLEHVQALSGYKRWFYHFLTPKLQPGSYEYHIEGESQTYKVVYPDEAKAQASGFSFLWLADMGVKNSDGITTVLDDLVNSVDFVVHGGDIAYADDRDVFGDNSDTYNDIYDSQGHKVINTTTSRAYMVCPGNHDVSCHSWSDVFCEEGIRNFSYYRNRQRMPSNGAGNMWYSFDQGFVHFVSISTETDYPDAPEGGNRWVGVPNGGPFGDQLAWLEADLKQNDKLWTVVYGHRPLRSSYNSRQDWPLGVEKETRAAFEPLFDKYNVDVYLAGHKHSYERLWPMRNGKVVSHSYDNITALVQITSGAAGSVEGHEDEGATEDFVAYKNWLDWGVNTLRWVNKTALEIQFITENKEVKDYVMVTKHPAAFQISLKTS